MRVRRVPQGARRILIVMNIAFFSVYPTTEDVQTHEETIMLEE